MWGTSQFDILLIHMSFMYTHYHVITDVNQIRIGHIKWSGRVLVIALDGCQTLRPFRIFNFFFSFAVIILTINSLLYCQTVCGASNYRWSWAITSGVPALLGMVLLSCALCNGAIKYHVKRWCQLRRWCTSQFAILLIPYVIIICSRYGPGISI